MALSARAEPDRNRPLGHARILVSGLPAGAGIESFRLRREGYAANDLGPQGWQVGEAALRPAAVETEAGALVLVVGPALTRHVEPGPLYLVLPGLGEVPLFWPDDIEIFDGTIHGAPPPGPAEPPPPRTAPPEEATVMLRPPPPRGDPPPAPEPGRRRRLPIGLALLALLLAAGLGWQFREPLGLALGLAEAGRSAPRPAPPRPPPALPWPERADTLTPREIVAQAPDAAGIRAAALRRQAQQRHDDALLLFEEAAERRDAPAMTALGRMYDPQGFVPGRPFRNPDPRAAARYYRDAERAGDAAAVPLREALRRWLEAEARAGSAAAASTLREFW